jgi:hypothetical protein
MGGNVFKIIRTFVIAVVVAVSLLGSASFASADQGPGRAPHNAPPVHQFDVTWE